MASKYGRPSRSGGGGGFFTKLIIAIVVLAAIGYFGVRFIAAKSFESLARSAAPVMTITYSGTFGGFDGSLGASMVRMQRVDEPSHYITVQELTLRTPGFFWLLKHAFSEVSEMPERIGFRLRGLQLSDDLERLQYDSDTQGFMGVLPLEAAGCGARPRFGREDYPKLGWSAAETNVDLEIRYGQADRSLEVAVLGEEQGLANYAFQTRITGVDMRRAADPSLARELRIERVSLTVEDQGAVAQRNEFCAKQLNIAAGDFAARHVDAVLALLRSHGAEPDAAVVEVYRRFATGGGRLELASMPSRTTSLMDYGHYSPTDQLGLLNVSLKHDDEPVTPLRMRFFDPRAVAATPEGGDAAAPADSSAVPESDAAVPADGTAADATAPADAAPVAAATGTDVDSTAAPAAEAASPDAPPIAGQDPLRPPPRAAAVPDLIPVAELDQHVGGRIEVSTNAGKRHIGILQAVHPDGIEVRVFVSGAGTATYKVKRSAIVQVRRLGEA